MSAWCRQWDTRFSVAFYYLSLFYSDICTSFFCIVFSCLIGAWKAHVAALSGMGYLVAQQVRHMWNLTPCLGYRSCDDCWSLGKCVSVYLPATTTGPILTNCSRNVSADTPPPAYMPPDEQMGQESQSMDTSSNLVPPNMARGGENCTQLHFIQKTFRVNPSVKSYKHQTGSQGF